LLESMPIELDATRLSQVSGLPVTPTAGSHALAIIDHVRQQVYEDRTGTNRAVKEKDATINQLRIAMPDAPGGVEGDEDSLRAQVQAAKDMMHVEHHRIDAKLTGVRAESAARLQKLKDDARAQIDAINAELSAAIETERASLADIEAKAARVRQKATDTATATAQPLQAAVAAIATNRDAAAKRKATADTITMMATELADLQADAARQTKALDDIDAYKAELLANLPIPDLEVVDGEVYRKGVPFDRLNTAQRVGIAFEIAKLRAGELKAVCLDGCELLDEEHLKELERNADESGIQVFITRVTGKEFAVETK
ncbi:MAG: hypothetical protein RLZZ618_1617, partial [Pseudomonadota bacterium]